MRRIRQGRHTAAPGRRRIRSIAVAVTRFNTEKNMVVWDSTHGLS
jgi:hypothetical protein